MSGALRSRGLRWLWLGPLLLSMLLPFAWMVAVSLAPGAGGSFMKALRGPWGIDHYRALFAVTLALAWFQMRVVRPAGAR